MNEEIIASLPLPKQNLAASLCRASDGLQDLRGRYGCEHWTIEKSVHQRIDAFKLWCLRRLLRVPWTARRSNQSILKEINPIYSLRGLILKLKLQCLGHLMPRTDSLEKTLMLGKIEGKRRRGAAEDEMVRWHHRLKRHEFEQSPENSKGAWQAAVHEVTKS